MTTIQNTAMIELFGAEVTARAAKTDPVDLELTQSLMTRVEVSVSALKALSGDLEAQRRYVQGLPEEVQVVLAMWVDDMELTQTLRNPSAEFWAFWEKVLLTAYREAITDPEIVALIARFRKKILDGAR